MIANYRTSGAGRDPYLRQEGGRLSRERNEKGNHTKSLTSSIVGHVPLSAYIPWNEFFFSSRFRQSNGRKGLNRGTLYFDSVPFPFFPRIDLDSSFHLHLSYRNRNVISNLGNVETLETLVVCHFSRFDINETIARYRYLFNFQLLSSLCATFPKKSRKKFQLFWSTIQRTRYSVDVRCLLFIL